MGLHVFPIPTPPPAPLLFYTSFFPSSYSMPFPFSIYFSFLAFLILVKVQVAQSSPAPCGPMTVVFMTLLSPLNSPGKNTGVGSHDLLQIFPTQGLNLGFLNCRQILYHLSHQGSPFLPLILSLNTQLHIKANLMVFKGNVKGNATLFFIWTACTVFSSRSPCFQVLKIIRDKQDGRIINFNIFLASVRWAKKYCLPFKQKSQMYLE